MSRKEWLEVGRQCAYFVLVVAGMVALFGLVGLLDGKPLEGEKAVIMLGLWLWMFSLFIGLSPFAMDSSQKGMEYLLSLPYSRRRLLFIKILPRLAAVVLFYLLYVLLYGSIGHEAFGGGFVLFSLVYFALFSISFSLALVHENFIVQSVWAAIALGGYLALCLFIVMLGMSWKFKVPAAQVMSGVWHNLSFDPPTLLVSIVVFILLAAPFVLSLFLAFKKFDLRGGRAFNRRQLRIFAPLLLAALGVSLGLTYFVQSRTVYWDPEYIVLKGQRLLKAGFPGKLDLYDRDGRRNADMGIAAFWERRPLLMDGDRVYLSGYDTGDGSQFIGCLNLADLSWKELHRFPHGYVVSSASQGIFYDGESFVYLKGGKAGNGRTDDSRGAGSGILELVRVDPANGRSRAIVFRDQPFRRYQESFFIGSDEREGQRFWLIARRWHNVLRLWADGRVEDLDQSKGLATYAGGILFSRGDGSLQVRRLLASGSETAGVIEGRFTMVNHPYFFSPGSERMSEIYAKKGKRIVRIDLATLNVEDIGPEYGHIWLVSPGDFYYVEFETWPSRNTDKWKKLYRLQGGRMVFLKQFDFGDAGYGNVELNENGVILWQHQIVGRKSVKISKRFFAFPDLRELHFKGLD